MNIKSIYFVILVLLLSTVHSQDSSKDLGISGCKYWGLFQEKCKRPGAPIEGLPIECTSLIYDGIRIDAYNNVRDSIKNGGATLDKLLATNITVMMYFGYQDQQEWTTALGLPTDRVTTIAKEVMQSLKTYVEIHTEIKGFIFDNLEGRELHSLTGNIKIYIDEMRATFPDMAIGMNMKSDSLKYYLITPNTKWLDFKMLSPLFDFFELQFLGLNTCVTDAEKTGTFPLFPLTNMITIDSLVQYLKKVGIPTTKLHYHYQTYGDATGQECARYYPFICSSTTNSNKIQICADTQQSFYDKGGYANLNGKGIVATIDVDDFESICECGHAYPAFYALLDGFTRAPVPSGCPLFDRTQS